MAAFAAAWAVGVGWVETDVQPTADGVPVLLHDDDLDRTTDGSGPVRSRAWAELSGLDAGSWFPGFAGQRLPALADLLATLRPGRNVLLEIKGPHTPAQLTAELTALDPVLPLVVLQSFEVAALAEIHRQQPDRPLGLLVGALHDDPVAACAAVGATGYHPDHLLLRQRPEVVDQVRGAGLTVLVWTADEPEDWAYLTGLGVDGIITNRPAELLAWQREH